MIHPIVTSLHHCVVGSEDDEGGRLLGIIELLRSADSSHEPFSDIELETLHNYLIWADMALNYCELCFNVGRQKDLKNFLLNVVK